jgi:hypothetical protein
MKRLDFFIVVEHKFQREMNIDGPVSLPHIWDYTEVSFAPSPTGELGMESLSK